MPLYFWNDPDGEKYRNAYFTVYPNIWRHGDYIVMHSDTGGITFYGRSDAVLKPSGVRIGTAEIYTQMEKLPEIADSLAIGQNWQGDQRVILFVKLSPGFSLTEGLKDKDEDVKQAASLAIAELADRSFIKELRPLLDDKSTEGIAKKTIQKIQTKKKK